jgi:DNA-binding transcriptional LysR family regulator
VFHKHSGNLRIQTYPEMDKTSYELVRQAQIDFYFDYKPPQDNRLDSCQLGEEEVVVIARKHHPNIATRLTKKDYLNAEHVILDFQHQNLTMLEDLLQRKTRIHRNAVAQVRQFVSVPELVTKTDCIATVPRRMAEYYSKRDAIRIFPFPFRIEKSKAYMIWHKAMNRDKGHQWLKSVIISLQGE